MCLWVMQMEGTVWIGKEGLGTKCINVVFEANRVTEISRETVQTGTEKREAWGPHNI